MAKKSYDFLFKILLIGDSGVEDGVEKTQLLFRLCCNPAYNSHFISTIGIDFQIRNMDIDGAKIKLQVWADQERFHTITSSYYRGAMGIILVYDVTVEKTFENIRKWIRNVEENASKDVQVMILGNNCHMEAAQRQVSRERGEELALECGTKFMEVNSKDGTNVEEAFLTLVTAIKRKVETGCAFERLEVMDPQQTEAESAESKESCVIS